MRPHLPHRPGVRRPAGRAPRHRQARAPHALGELHLRWWASRCAFAHAGRRCAPPPESASTPTRCWPSSATMTNPRAACAPWVGAHDRGYDTETEKLLSPKEPRRRVPDVQPSGEAQRHVDRHGQAAARSSTSFQADPGARGGARARATGRSCRAPTSPSSTSSAPRPVGATTRSPARGGPGWVARLQAADRHDPRLLHRRRPRMMCDLRIATENSTFAWFRPPSSVSATAMPA